MNSRVKRIFVEKKPGLDVESQDLFKELNEFLGIKGLKGLRTIHRYDIEGITKEVYDKSRDTIFSEPPVDRVYDEEFEIPKEDRFIAVEFLPGQYDQRADSAAQCIQILTHGEKPDVRCAKLILLSGEISDQEYEKIKDYCINPLESREASLEKPASLKMEIDYPEKVKQVTGFIEMDKEELDKIHQKFGLAMSDEDLFFIQDYFKKEKRDPTLTEIRVLDTYWSDHCRHTTFLTEIKDIKFTDGAYTPAIEMAYKKYRETRNMLYGEKEKDKAVCLMDIATIGMKEMKNRGLLDDLDQSEEINACSIEVDVDVNGQDEKWLVMFKNETHNHPTEIEPFGGAATCLGGAIRDPLSGRAYVYQAMRITGSADPRTPIEQTMEGKLPQRKITTGAADGYSSYGNQIGLATGQVREYYHQNFVAKRMEIGAVIGAAPVKNVVRKSPQKDDVIILLGGKTGRDGCGGATGSSKKHTEESLTSCGAEVQKGNPPTERKIQRLFRNPEVSTMIKKCNDFGAGGVSVAIGELADSLDINLDRVPKKYEGLDGTELAISESQERMAIVLDKKDVYDFIEAAIAENLEATPVAVVTDSGRLRMYWQGNTIVDISRDFLNTHGATQYSKVSVLSPDKENNFLKNIPEKIGDKLSNLKDAWLNNLMDLNVCSQKGLKEMFDSTIGAGTVFLPFSGRYQMTPLEGMVAKIPVMNGETTTGTIMTSGYNPDLACWSPFHGAVYAVVSAVARSVAIGGDYRNIRLTLQEYFEKPGEDSTRWGKPFCALLGAYLVQTELGLPAIGGKDSMSGTFKEIDVPPTLVAFAVNTANVNHMVSPEFKDTNNRVIWIRIKHDDFDVPVFTDLKEKYAIVHKLMKEGKVKSSMAVSEGGIAAAVTKMAFGNNIGLKINDNLDRRELFLPEFGSIILEVTDDADLSSLSDYIPVGTTIDEPLIIMENENKENMRIALNEALETWTEPLEDVFPTKTEYPRENPEIDLYQKRNKKNPRVNLARPVVFIPVFPGTNCEYDSAYRFKKAGARVETFVFKNLNQQLVEESIETMVKKIDDSQMIMLPGGFSAGDEPEGSGKFIATVFRNPAIRDSVMRLLNDRDGLILGICNGFQALIKLGLLPFGEIRDIDEDSPTLTFNTIGRHVSCMVKTKVISTLSPWLANVEAGMEHMIPVSHGEGRFVADDETVERLKSKGQIATQYVNLQGEPTFDIQYNPNGSVMAIEGITSPDGRVFGKMGHSERIGTNVARNIPGNKNQKIFEAGVAYFQ